MLKLFLQTWLNLICPCLFGIGMGPSSGEYSEAGALGNIGGFSTSTGMGDVSQASDFWKAILSGNQTQMSRVLGPAYSNINQRGGQELKTLSEFGTRSGGTEAQQQQIGDTMRSQASTLEGNLLGGAASSLGQIGSGLLSTGLSATEAAFRAQQTIQQQKAAKLNDIFKSIADIGLAPFTGGASLTGLTGGSTSSFNFSWPKWGSSTAAPGSTQDMLNQGIPASDVQYVS